MITEVDSLVGARRREEQSVLTSMKRGWERFHRPGGWRGTGNTGAFPSIPCKSLHMNSWIWLLSKVVTQDQLDISGFHQCSMQSNVFKLLLGHCSEPSARCWHSWFCWQPSSFLTISWKPAGGYSPRLLQPCFAQPEIPFLLQMSAPGGFS